MVWHEELVQFPAGGKTFSLLKVSTVALGPIQLPNQLVLKALALIVEQPLCEGDPLIFIQC
jgi:hypothetical protein